jgi:hypothetical protein
LHEVGIDAHASVTPQKQFSDRDFHLFFIQVPGNVGDLYHLVGDLEADGFVRIRALMRSPMASSMT